MITVPCFVISHRKALLLNASYNFCFSGQHKNTVTCHRFSHLQVECRGLARSDMHFHRLENVSDVCCVLCLCRQTPLAQSNEFSAAPVKNDRSLIEACRRCQSAATIVEVSRTVFHLRFTTCGSLVVGYSRSSTLWNDSNNVFI